MAEQRKSRRKFKLEYRVEAARLVIETSPLLFLLGSALGDPPLLVIVGERFSCT